MLNTKHIDTILEPLNESTVKKTFSLRLVKLFIAIVLLLLRLDEKATEDFSSDSVLVQRTLACQATLILT